MSKPVNPGLSLHDWAPDGTTHWDYREWVLLMGAVAVRLDQCDPVGQPLTFRKLVAALEFSVANGLHTDSEVAHLVRDQVAREVVEQLTAYKDDEIPWPVARALLGDWVAEAVAAGAARDAKGAIVGMLRVFDWKELVKLKLGLVEEEIALDRAQLGDAINALLAEPGRTRLHPDELLKATGLDDLEQYSKDLVALEVSRLEEAASMRREDGVLLRGLVSIWGVKAVQGWETIPWIVIPAAWRDERDVVLGGADDEITPHDVDKWLRESADDNDDPISSLLDGVRILDHSPWERAVLQVPMVWVDEISVKWKLHAPPKWIRFMQLGRRDSLPAQRPWLDRTLVDRLRDGDWLLVDHILTEGNYAGGPVDQPPKMTYNWVFTSFALDRSDPWGPDGVVFLGHAMAFRGNPDVPDQVAVNQVPAGDLMPLAKLVRPEVLFYLSLLSAGDEHPVAVVPTRDLKPAPWKKPWLRRDRPYVILLDPSGVAQRRAEGGVPSGRRVRLHQTRGHWRRYQAERYTEERRAQRQWIRQAWAGAREWVTGGVTYRVMTKPDGTLGTGQGG